MLITIKVDEKEQRGQQEQPQDTRLGRKATTFAWYNGIQMTPLLSTSCCSTTATTGVVHTSVVAVA